MQVEDGFGSLLSERLEVIMRNTYRNRGAKAPFGKNGRKLVLFHACVNALWEKAPA
jgi:hypothetical protein